jgi:serine/threonine protein kinase
VTVYDVGQDDGVNYIVMEYVEGQDLQALLQARAGAAPMRIGQALDIVIQICTAVAFAHERGILHCDLKPHNVMILADGQVKVTDFGIARALSADQDQGPLWATPHYASPELLAGQALTPASDIYSIGVILYELIAGRRPFDGTSAAQVARQHVLNAPTPVQQYNPRAPRYIQQILDRTLAKEPTSRYTSAKQLAQFLIAYRQHGEAVTQPLQPIVVTDAKPAPPPPPRVSSVPPVRTLPKPGFDWLMLILAGLAFLSVMGLLPLWGTVISRALSQPTVTPTPTPVSTEQTVSTPTPAAQTTTHPATPTPTSEVQVLAPDIIGQELEEARRLVREKGLTLAVIEQRHDSEVPASHVIAQDPPSNRLLAPGAEIGVVVSLGPKMILMPVVVGFPAAIEQLDLQDLEMLVVITETWSLEPVGLVISQTPPAGTEIPTGSTVTLTVSSGSQNAVRANLGQKVLLASCEFNELTFHRGDVLQMIITWEVLARFSDSYKVFIHITDDEGHILTQLDKDPLDGNRPTNTWQPGEKFLDPYTLILPANASPGSYWVRVGMYRGDTRLDVVDPGLARQKDNAVLVRQITVQGN